VELRRILSVMDADAASGLTAVIHYTSDMHTLAHTVIWICSSTLADMQLQR